MNKIKQLYKVSLATVPEPAPISVGDEPPRRKQRKILSGSYLPRSGDDIPGQVAPPETVTYIKFQGRCQHGLPAEHGEDKNGEFVPKSIDCLRCYPFCDHGNLMDETDILTGNRRARACVGCNIKLCTTQQLWMQHAKMNGLPPSWIRETNAFSGGHGSAEMDLKDARRRSHGPTKPRGVGTDTYHDEQIRVDDLGFVPGAIRDSEERESGDEVRVGDANTLVDEQEAGVSHSREDSKDDSKIKRCSPRLHMELTWKLKRRSDYVTCGRCGLQVFKPSMPGTKWKK